MAGLLRGHHRSVSEPALSHVWDNQAWAAEDRPSVVTEPGPTWMGWVRNLGMFILGGGLLVNEAVFRTANVTAMALYGALMAGPVFFESFLARK